MLFSNKITLSPVGWLLCHIFVQSLSHVRLFVTLWTAAHHASLSFIVFESLLKLVSIESVMPSNHAILCCPFLLLPSAFLSIRVLSNELALCIRWLNYWSFSISLSNECSELISFRIDCFDLLTFKQLSRAFSAPQFKSINSSMPSRSYCPTLTSIHDY